MFQLPIFHKFYLLIHQSEHWFTKYKFQNFPCHCYRFFSSSPCLFMLFPFLIYHFNFLLREYLHLLLYSIDCEIKILGPFTYQNIAKTMSLAIRNYISWINLRGSDDENNKIPSCFTTTGVSPRQLIFLTFQIFCTVPVANLHLPVWNIIKIIAIFVTFFCILFP